LICNQNPWGYLVVKDNDLSRRVSYSHYFRSALISVDESSWAQHRSAYNRILTGPFMFGINNKYGRTRVKIVR
jgi:hypothetical protein